MDEDSGMDMEKVTEEEVAGAMAAAFRIGRAAIKWREAGTREECEYWRGFMAGLVAELTPVQREILSKPPSIHREEPGDFMDEGEET